MTGIGLRGSPGAPPSLAASSPDGWRVSEETWEALLKQAVLYATSQIRRLRWRGALNGTLPGGYDPNSIVAEAIAELFIREASVRPATDMQKPTPAACSQTD